MMRSAFQSYRIHAWKFKISSESFIKPNRAPPSKRKMYILYDIAMIMYYVQYLVYKTYQSVVTRLPNH